MSTGMFIGVQLNNQSNYNRTWLTMLISATTRQLSQLNGKLHEFHFEKYFIMTPSLDRDGENI